MKKFQTITGENISVEKGLKKKVRRGRRLYY